VPTRSWLERSGLGSKAASAAAPNRLDTVRVFVAGATGAIGRQLLPLVALMAAAMGIRNATVRRVAVRI